MEEQVANLVDQTWEQYQKSPHDHRFMIAIAGMPGSGKTSLAERLTQRLNEKQLAAEPDSGPIAAYCPMDGYHWPRSVLDTFDPEMEAHARRGAEFTFDGESFLKLVESLRVPLEDATTQSIFAPSFDHALKDPVDNDIEIRPTHKIVVFEGNYVCLDQGPWRKAADLMDMRWFVQVDEDVAAKRLAARHEEKRLVPTYEAGLERAELNDLPNGRFLTEHKVPNIDLFIQSMEDFSWASIKSRSANL